MSADTDLNDLDRLHGDGTAVLVVDEDGRVLMCSGAVQELTGEPPSAVCGRPVADLFTDPDVWPGLAGGPGGSARNDTAVLRRRGGTPVEVRLETHRAQAVGGAAFLVQVSPMLLAKRREEDEALVRALFRQTRVGLAIHDMKLVTTRLSLTPESQGPPTQAGVPVRPLGRGIEEALLPEDAAAVGEQLRRVAETGEPLVDWVHSARRRDAPELQRFVSLSAFRLQDAKDRPIGVAVVFTEVTDQHLARERMALLHAASERIGRTLDVPQVAQELADVLVAHGFADLAAVDLTGGVLAGREPEELRLGVPVRRVAVASSAGRWPPEIHPLGAAVLVGSLENDVLRTGTAFCIPNLAEVRESLADDPERSRLLLPRAATSFMVVPLIARGLVLGALGLWRTGTHAPFGRPDAELAEEVASRASLGLDNARRYTRERRTTEALQRSLLPKAVVETSAAEAVGTYVPAGTTAGIGGSWFDVIPLPSARLAFVIGDVGGHGLGAAATMGRLRTAVQTLADLDLPPGELLTHLDDIAIRLADTEAPRSASVDPAAAPPRHPVVGATCLYCLYDPVRGRCTMASAGHPPPVLAGPGHKAGLVRLKPGPPLGVGGLPFEPVDFDVAPGSLLAFYTENLLTGGGGTVEKRLDRLRSLMRIGVERHRAPSDLGRAVLGRLLLEPPTDDVSLLIARVRALPPDTTVAWEFPADPAVVARARRLVAAQLAAWGLEHLSFSTELITSELVTNAIRYGGPPVGLRLIRDETLICEVSDASQTQPRLRRARHTDEGGRGLFLVAQVSHRWGSRYTPSGKTIWTEQSLAPLDPPL